MDLMKRFIIYLIPLAILISSCQKILFNDEESTRVILLQDFHNVKIYGIFKIVLIQDSLNKLVITGNNDINSIGAWIMDGELVIEDPSKMSFNTDKNRLEIHFTSLESVVPFNPVSISNVDTIKADIFIFDAVVEVAEVNLVVDCNILVVGSANSIGEFHLSGKAGVCYLYCLYGCSFLGEDLSCRVAEIHNESVGDVYINASESITAFIRGPGNIYYHGNPVIDIAEKRGDGRVIRMD